MDVMFLFLFLVILIFVVAMMIRIVLSAKLVNDKRMNKKLPWDKAVCINLDKNPERWVNILRYSREMNMNIERFPGVWGKELDVNNPYNVSPTELQIEWDTTINGLYDPMIRKLGKTRMTSGEIGCALSHIRIWKKYQAIDIETILIIEDDAEFIDSFRDIIEILWEMKPLDWDIIFLGFSNAGRKITKYNKYFYKPEYGFETVGYIVNKRGLNKLVSMLPVSGPVDVWLSERFYKLNVWAIEPRLITQNKMGKGDVQYSSHQN